MQVIAFTCAALAIAANANPLGVGHGSGSQIEASSHRVARYVDLTTIPRLDSRKEADPKGNKTKEAKKDPKPKDGDKDKDKNKGGKAAGLPDGRIKKDAKPADFDAESSPFKTDNVLGQGLKFSDIITFPDVPPSIFDKAKDTKALEISIDDKSIFAPGGKPQDKFRRADLVFNASTTAKNSTTQGKKTVHFSVQQDPAKALALKTDEYQLSFLETADFANRIYDVRVGTGGTSPSLTGENIVVLGRSGDKIAEMFVAPFTPDLQNFAVELDFDKNTMKVFHSTGQEPLKSVSEATANDNSGDGEYHFALLKLGNKEGKQTAGINEGIIYAGIFMEDTSKKAPSLQ